MYPKQVGWEETLVVAKSEALEENKLGVIIAAFEEVNLKIVDIKMVVPSLALVESHYQEHKLRHEKREAPYYPDLAAQFVDHHVVPMRVAGEDAIGIVDRLVGPFQEEQRVLHPECLRARLMKPGDPGWRNFVHRSKTAEDAERELRLWFPQPFV